MGRTEGERPLGRLWRRWEDNIKMHAREVGLEDMGWIDLAMDREMRRALVSAVMNLRIPQHTRNFLTVGFSVWPLLHGVS